MMLKNTVIILSLIYIIVLLGCEQTVNDANLPYVEQLVIDAALTPGDFVHGISITKTLPPMEDYSREKSLVPGADVKIICDGKEYKLIDNAGEGWFYNRNLIPEIGKTYELQVRWNGKYAHAITTIPQPVTIDSAFYTITNGYWPNSYYFTVYGLVHPKENACYCPLNQIHCDTLRPYIFSHFTSRSVCINSDADQRGNITIRIIGFSIGNKDLSSFVNSFNESSEGYGIAAMDIAFYDYYRTSDRGSQSNDIFGTSGENIKWNIQGDGIGLFYGRTITIKKIKL